MEKFKIKQSDKFVTVEEMNLYEGITSDLRRMLQFHGEKWDEKEHLETVILDSDSKCKKLVHAYQLNASCMNYLEVSQWSKTYNEASRKRNLYLRLYFVRMGENFVFPED
jgi:hypothetical protein